jgi:hypothetical protein
MQRGEWQQTHQGIALDEQGRLLDGQQRLNAIVDSEQPQWLLVSRGAPEDILMVVDEGTKRSPADYFRFRNESDNAGLKAAAATLLWRYRTERFASAQQVTNDVIYGLYHAEPGLGDAVGRQEHKMATKLQHVSPAVSIVGAHLTYLSCETAQVAREFLDGLRLGTGLDLDDARYTLREELQRGKKTGIDSSTIGSQYKSRLVLNLWGFCLDRWLEGRATRNLPQRIADSETVLQWPELDPPDYDAEFLGLASEDEEEDEE